MSEIASNDSQEIEPHTHAFVVKVWREHSGSHARCAVWRGYITHVVSGQRCYVTKLSQLDFFIALYLRALGAKLPLRWRIYQWFSR